ncbi:MAG: tetratricopeptide repeat protein, partial [Dokdonella sp.]|nr:tetratricopeptide repeat protein [Dokdonella sp.]
MNPAAARWAELAPLLDRVLDAGPDEREAVIATLAIDDELRTALLDLLAHESAAGILDDEDGRVTRALLEDAPPVAWPQIVGPYRIVRLLGEGGSGSVFLAEREVDGYVQRVALKLLRSGVRDPAERERFRRERRILARLEHAHIARLIDGGFDDDGVPWFALEYVDGEPLTAWCDARRLDVDARLALFDDICAAVAHAHRALVVHRDLKPANILVDDGGRVRLLDFGIAHLLDPSTRTEATRTGLRRLTPAYAAPEQFDGGAITTATDVYALGVLLHELLTGLRPQRYGDGDIRLPSALFAADTHAQAFATARSSNARALVRRLRGDLDTVLAVALARDPSRRYAGVEAFAEDLRRHRTQRPVLARRPSPGYRFARFLRRHRAASALAVLLVLSLAAGIVATVNESRNAREAATQALREAARADAAKHFVLALFSGVTPDESRGREVGARELLERGEARLAETLAQQPQLEAELSTVLAGAWRQLGALDRAAALATRAHAVASDPAARHAAAFEQANVLAAQGHFDEAESALRSALAEAPDARAKAGARVRLAELLAERGHPDAALALLAEALAADRDDADLLLRDTAALGRVRFRAGDLDRAEEALRDALVRARDVHGDVHTLTAGLEHDLAVVLIQRGNAKEAADLLDGALRTRTLLLGARHPDVAQSRFDLAVARQRLGDTASARTLYEEALVTQRAALGEHHPDVASSLNSLAMLDYAQGRHDAAITRLGEALAVARTAWGEAHPTVATMLGNLAGIERAAGRIDDAARDQQAALTA